MEPTLAAGDRVLTPNGDPATVIRPNRLDANKSIIWPERWGRLPQNLTNGPGMCLHNDSLKRLAPTPTPPRRRPVAPNPSLNPTIQPSRPPEGLTR